MRGRIVIVSTGGTISSRPQVGQAGYAPALTGEHLAQSARLHDLAIPAVVDEFAQILSPAMTPAMMFRLAGRIASHVRNPAVIGVVVTHGTSTLEESAFMADLLHRGAKPVVFTGAMYPASAPEWDGPRNLKDACLVAAAPRARNMGVFIVLGGEIHAAREAIKFHRSSPQAFASPGLGPLGIVEEGKVILLRRPARRVTIRSRAIRPEVDIVTVTAGSDDRHFQASLRAGARAIVLQGMPGRGSVPPALLPAIRGALRRRIPVVLTSRSTIGRVIAAGGGESGPANLARLGVLMGGDLPAPKLRILLMVLLGMTRDPHRLEAAIGRVSP